MDRGCKALTAWLPVVTLPALLWLAQEQGPAFAAASVAPRLGVERALLLAGAPGAGATWAHARWRGARPVAHRSPLADR
jgi:hypothetical protein